MSRREERAFSTASSTSSPEILIACQSWAFTNGIATDVAALMVLNIPTSIFIGSWPSPMDMNIACFLMVLWYEAERSICGKRDAYEPFFAKPVLSISMSATFTDTFSLKPISSACSNVTTTGDWAEATNEDANASTIATTVVTANFFIMLYTIYQGAKLQQFSGLPIPYFGSY